MNGKIKLFFLSFADHRLWMSLKRIKKQALEIGVFDKIYCWDESNLGRNFWKKWKHIMPFNGSDYKSAGFFIWKPQIVMQVLEKMQEGDILLYCDVGCHLHKYGRKKMLEYVDICNNNNLGILCFHTGQLERKYTKGDVFDYFGCRNNVEIYNTEQLGASVIFFKKCEKCLTFVENWRQLFFDNFELCGMGESISPNFDDFIASRHDQSIFSILAKQNNASVIDGIELVPFPITSARDRKHPLWNRAMEKLRKYIRIDWERNR